MNDLAALNVGVSYKDVLAATDALDKFSATGPRAEAAVSRVGQKSRAASAEIQLLTRAATALFGAFSAAQVIKMADAFSDINSRVKLAAGSISAGSSVMDELGVIARRTYSSLTQTAEGYLANASTMRELGYSTQEVLNYTSALNNAMVVSGAKAERAASVQNALAKAMALGRLSGEDLNTVIATGGRVAELLAERFNTTQGGLRKLGAEGKITGGIVADVLLKNMERLNDEAESMPATFGDAFTIMTDKVLQSVGAMDQAGKVSERFAANLITVADNIDLVIKAGGLMVAVMGGRYLSAAIASMASYGKATYGAAVQTQGMAQIERLASAAILESARSELAATETTLARVRAEQSKAVVIAGNTTNEFAYAAMQKQVMALEAARIGQIAAINRAQTAMSATLQATTASATAASVAMRGMGAASAFLGGPLGIALTGLAGMMYLVSVRAAEAEDRAASYAEMIKRAGENSDFAALGIEKSVSALIKVEAAGKSVAQAIASLQIANDNIAKSSFELEEAFNSAGRGIAGFSTYMSKAYAPLGDLVKRMIDGTISAENFQKASDDLAKIDPDMSAFIARLQEVARQLAATRGEAEALASVANGLGGKGARVGTEGDQQRDDRTDWEFGYMSNFSDRFNGYGDVTKSLIQQADALDKPSKKAASAAQRMEDRYNSLLRAANDRVSQMELEAQLVGKNTIAADVLRMQLEAEQEVIKRGLDPNDKRLAQIKAAAESYGELARKVEEYRLMEEATFARQQMFRSPIDQQIASDLKQAGIEMDSVAGQAYASFVRTTDQIGIAKDATKSFASGFISDILAGKSALEALTGALSKLADKLLDMALDQAINLLFGNLLGITGGGLFGGGLSPFANSGQLATSFAGGGLGLYAEGGISNKPAIFGEAGPEAAVPLPDGRSIPVTLYNAGGGANDNERDGSVLRLDVNISGARGNTEIREMVAAGVQEGLTQFDREILPRRFRQIAQDPYAVG